MVRNAPRSKFPAHTIYPSATIAEAAQSMWDQGVSALVVVDPRSGVPLFTITDRDFVCVTAEGLDPRGTSLEQYIGCPGIGEPPECWFG
jgi:CBS domain-containing protein